MVGFILFNSCKYFNSTALHSYILLIIIAVYILSNNVNNFQYLSLIIKIEMLRNNYHRIIYESLNEYHLHFLKQLQVAEERYLGSRLTRSWTRFGCRPLCLLQSGLSKCVERISVALGRT